MSAVLTSEPASAAALVEFYGELPAVTTKSWVVKMDGRTVGVVGAAIESGHATLFSDVAPDLEPHLRSMTVLRAVRAGINIAKATGLPVLAYIEQEGGAKILEREGFVDHDEPGWKRWVPC